MKKPILLFSLFLTFATFCHALTGEPLSKYQLKKYNTVEEFQEAYLNKVITYSPVLKYDPFLGKNVLSQEMNLGYRLRDFIVTSIIGKTKKRKDTQIMTWTIKEVNGETTRTFKVYTGNYKKNPIYYKYDYPDDSEYNRNVEFMLEDLPFFIYSAWKEDHKSEIGQLFENPIVKAKYEVTDVFLEVYRDIILKKYTLKNTISGEKANYIAEEAQSECFKEDISGKYVSTLAKVEKPSNPSIKFGTTTIIEDEGITKYSYEDNFIRIIIFGNSEGFRFNLKNVSEITQKLVWDDAVFVSYSGSISKVMHNGIKFSQREESQVASTIIRGASITEIACPTSNVYYSELIKDWTTKSMYPTEFSFETKQVQLMLPIQIKDVVNEYIFIFDVKFCFNHPERINFPVTEQ